MSNPEQSAGEQGDGKSGLNEHLKEDKAAGEVFQTVSRILPGCTC